MRKTLLVMAAVSVLLSSQLSAQVPLEANPLDPVPSSVPNVTPQSAPPEVAQYPPSWSRRESARQAVIRRAAWKAAQRTQRIEAMKWYGYSPQRPAVSALPWMGSTSSWIGSGVIYYHYPGVFYPRTASRGVTR